MTSQLLNTSRVAHNVHTATLKSFVATKLKNTKKLSLEDHQKLKQVRVREQAFFDNVFAYVDE